MKKISVVALLCLFITLPAHSGQKPGRAAIASAHPAATAAGHRILAEGGNAFDAAVAVAAVLAVVEPYSSGIGGGGFWLIHRAADNHSVMIDGRERAPLAAHRNMYLDKQGRIIRGLSINGPLAAGIPGQPAAMVYLARKYGKLPLSKSLAPAMALARDGFKVDAYYRRMAKFRLGVLRRYPETASILLDLGEIPAEGFVIRQPDLYRTLKQMADKGHDGFYRGAVAKKLVRGVRKAGGIWAMKDLAAYRVKLRRPIVVHYRGMKIISAAPPSSGGIAIGQVLNILAPWDLLAKTPAERIHLVVEAMRRAYRDRAEFLGDPDFVRVPVKKLLSSKQAKQWRRGISLKQATPSSSLPPVPVSGNKGRDTTHYSIIDKHGNRVSATLSINYPFGSGFIVPGTGVLLNDEMDDFSSKPGTPNVYGLVGADANAIAPGKRPLSSMSPTFVETRDAVMVIGTPGGSRIITMVLLGILNYDAGRNAEQIVNARRYHHQYLPDVIQHEKGVFSPAVMKKLMAMGHKLKLQGDYGNMQVVIWNRKTGKLTAASDGRGIGKAVVK